MEKNIRQKLHTIQSELKAPKNQLNKFGGFKYRSCEDILEALKPFLKKEECIIILTDEVMQLEGRFYIKGKATLSDMSGNVIEAVAFAREEENKKGMDASQVTGSTSSYARKYALNGLLGIDDSKDADDQKKEKGKKGEEVEEEKQEEKIEAPRTYKIKPEIERLINSSKTIADLQKNFITIPKEERYLYTEKVKTRKSILEANESKEQNKEAKK